MTQKVWHSGTTGGFRRDGDDPFDVTAVQEGESAKSIKYDSHGVEFWIPKSMIARGDIQVFNNETGTITITMPLWLAREKGLAK